MNLQQAKNIPITWFYGGIITLQNPKKSGREIRCCSPFREDHTSSFCIYESTNLSFDFGTNQMRDLVQSIQDYYSLKNTSEALLKLNELLKSYPIANYTSSFAQKVPLKMFDDKKRISPHTENQNAGDVLKIGDTEITEIKDLYYFPILNYIKSRKIRIETASLYFKEIYFKMKGKKYFGLCYQNRNGGYEVAGCGQKPFKTAIGNKDITVITGSENTNTVMIFEGMFDFLSYLEYEKLQKPKNDVIILNSVAIWERGVEFVQSKAEYKEIHLYLDNDKAGVQTAVKMKIALNELVNISKKVEKKYDVVDKSNLYKGFKDFGEWWENSCK